MRVTHEGKMLTIDGRTVELEQPVRRLLILEDCIVIQFDPEQYPHGDSRCERNVVAVDHKGKILWRIARSKGRTVDDEDGEIRSPFTSINLTEGGRVLQAYEWGGLQHDVDPQTGKLSNTIFTK